MKLVVPFSGHVRPWTRIALACYLYESREVVGNDGYPLLLAELWSSGEPFTVVEHDVVPWKGALEALWECPESWCGYGYGDENPALPLGCVKFEQSFIEAIPDVWRGLLDEQAEPWPRERWAWCDTWLDRYAANLGIGFHRHDPPVENRKDSPRLWPF